MAGAGGDQDIPMKLGSIRVLYKLTGVKRFWNGRIMESSSNFLVNKENLLINELFNHPITKGIEPSVINLDEQFGLFLRKPDDPDVTVLFKSQGVHDKQWTIQGVCAQRGRGRVVTFAPGHYNWTFVNEACQEILWRSANWVLNLPIPPFYGNYDSFIW